MNSKICPQCGARKPFCGTACRRAEADEQRERELAALERVVLPGRSVHLEFHGTLDEQRLLVNRLRAEWRWAIEIVDPIEPGDSYLANVAREVADLGGPLDLVYEVSLAGIAPSQAHEALVQAVQRAARRWLQGEIE